MNASTSARADRIVIVDDDARIRDLLRRYLSQEGFEVLLAEDGKALSRFLSRESVDLIVLDLMLPGEDGLSICRRLRNANDRTPIIMLSANAMAGHVTTAIDAGCDLHLSKPVRPDRLVAGLAEVLSAGT